MKKIFPLTKKLIEPSIFIFFAILTLIVRFQSFSIRIIDWDESHYFMMAKDLLLGYLPYVKIAENKPIGIVLVYAGALLTFGKTMFSIRILAWLSITCSSYLLYKIGNLLTPSNYITGILAGIFYSVYTFFNMGISANTEIFYTFFTILAFYLLFKNQQFIQESSQKIYKIFFWIGISLGLAFVIKYVVLFDIIALFMIILILTFITSQKSSKIKPKHIIKIFTLLLLGLALPQLLIAFLYLITGHWPAFVDANIFTFKYVSNVPFNAELMKDNLIHYLTPYKILLISLFLLIFFKWFPRKTKLSLAFILIWGLSILFELMFCLTHGWGHYYIQLLPPLCLLSAVLISESSSLFKFRIEFTSPVVFFSVRFMSENSNNLKYETKFTPPKLKVNLNYIFLCLLLIYFFHTNYLYIINSWDYSILERNIGGGVTLINKNKFEPSYDDRQQWVANYITEHVGTGKNIFILSEDYLIYDITKSKHKSRYIVPYMLIDSSFSSMLNQKEEMKKILAAKPEYIILPTPNYWVDHYESLISSGEIYSLLLTALKKDYTFELSTEDNVLYRLKKAK